MTRDRLLARIRLLLVLFMTGLLLAGITAIPLQWEVTLLTRLVADLAPSHSAVGHWVEFIHAGVTDGYTTPS